MQGNLALFKAMSIILHALYWQVPGPNFIALISKLEDIEVVRKFFHLIICKLSHNCVHWQQNLYKFSSLDFALWLIFNWT